MAKKNRINLFRTKSKELTPQIKEVKSNQASNKATVEPVEEHFFTFLLKPDIFTLLYSTLVFKWIQTDRVNILK